jgi:hypothetical protein
MPLQFVNALQLVTGHCHLPSSQAEVSLGCLHMPELCPAERVAMLHTLDSAHVLKRQPMSQDIGDLAVLHQSNFRAAAAGNALC